MLDEKGEVHSNTRQLSIVFYRRAWHRFLNLMEGIFITMRMDNNGGSVNYLVETDSVLQNVYVFMWRDSRKTFVSIFKFAMVNI
jgi:hypothetical protein